MATSVFINEFHYDNTGTDTGEFIEIAAPAGTDLTGWSIVRYNGANGLVYTSPSATETLSGIVDDQGDGFGTVVINYPSNGLQNGDPDGFALINAMGEVVQFLSYGGVFTAVGGPADGLTSTDVGVSQNSSTPIGASLQLTGSGTHYGDFTWSSTTENTKGALNTNQSFGGVVETVLPLINEFVFNHVGTDTNEYAEIFGSPNTDYSRYTLLQIEGDNGSFLGRVTTAQAIGTTDANGFWTTGFLNNAYQNGTQTLLLVEDFTGSLNQDLDTNDDGSLDIDITPWGRIVDDVAVSDGGNGDLTYSSTVLAPGFGGDIFTPGGASRIPNGQDTDTAADWVRNDFDLAGIPGFSGTPVVGEALNTPGAANTLVVAPPPPADITLISAIQGSGDTSPRVGQVVTVEAIVVGDFQNGDADDSRNLGGFYLQEEDADADGDASTSEGIFVFQGDFVGDVKIGDKVRVTGTVDEFFGETQIDTITAIEVIGAVNELPTAAVISLPAAGTTLSQDGRVQPDLEAFEGMRVVFAEELQITEMFQLDRFNEIKLSQGDRPAQFTQNSLPSVEGFAAHLQEVGARTITYDDGLSVQNAAITNLDGFANFNTANAPRMGDTIANLEGILSYQWAGNAASGATWRVRAAEDGTNTFEQATPRLATPEPVGGSLKVASFNVLNYFTTIDAPGISTANGSGPRGADDLTRFGVSPATAEFDRQTDKLVSTILAMDVDVLGLVEVENDFLPGSSGNAIEFLVNELNSVSGAQVYDWVNPGEQFIDASDAISVGVIYQLDAVSLAAGTSVEILRDEDLANLGLDFGQPVFNGPSTSRAPLAVSFQEVATGGVFTVAVNHFKSKGPGGSTGDNVDALNGAGAYNGTRLRSAIALDAWLDTDPTGSGDSDFLILGDLNSYAQEDPIRFLASEGYVDLAQQLIGPDSYSYVFDGQTGTLDYVLASTSLTPQVTGITEWHVNSDEADALDYNLDFGRDPAIFDGTVPYRNSDHDPVIVGLNLSTPKVVITGTPQRDVLTGTERNENFLASGGPDLITTGGGFDCITYTHIDQAGDTITDFELGADTFNFTELLQSIGYTGNDPLADVIRIESVGNSDRTRLSLELDQVGGGRPGITNFITLLGVDAAALNNADNFVF